MKTAAKWLGFALVAAGVAVIPLSIWIPGPSSTVAVLGIIVGCFVLLFSMDARPVEFPPGEPGGEVPGSEAEDGTDERRDRDSRAG